MSFGVVDAGVVVDDLEGARRGGSLESTSVRCQSCEEEKWVRVRKKIARR